MKSNTNEICTTQLLVTVTWLGTQQLLQSLSQKQQLATNHLHYLFRQKTTFAKVTQTQTYNDTIQADLRATFGLITSISPRVTINRAVEAVLWKPITTVATNTYNVQSLRRTHHCPNTKLCFYSKRKHNIASQTHTQTIQKHTVYHICRCDNGYESIL